MGQDGGYTPCCDPLPPRPSRKNQNMDADPEEEESEMYVPQLGKVINLKRTTDEMCNNRAVLNFAVGLLLRIVGFDMSSCLEPTTFVGEVTAMVSSKLERLHDLAPGKPLDRFHKLLIEVAYCIAVDHVSYKLVPASVHHEFFAAIHTKPGPTEHTFSPEVVAGGKYSTRTQWTVNNLLYHHHKLREDDGSVNEETKEAFTAAVKDFIKTYTSHVFLRKMGRLSESTLFLDQTLPLPPEEYCYDVWLRQGERDEPDAKRRKAEEERPALKMILPPPDPSPLLPPGSPQLKPSTPPGETNDPLLTAEEERKLLDLDISCTNLKISRDERKSSFHRGKHSAGLVAVCLDKFPHFINYAKMAEMGLTKEELERLGFVVPELS